MASRVSRMAFLPMFTALLIGCGQVTQETSAVTDGGSGANHETATAAPAASKPAPQPEPNQVIIDDFAYTPAALTVAPGTKVTWINRDDSPHTVTSTAKPRVFHSGTLDSDGRFSHVFTAPGTYEYYCVLHAHMIARIIVK
jgi:plastocyanin